MIKVISLLLSRINIKVASIALLLTVAALFVYTWHYKPLAQKKDKIRQQEEELQQQEKILKDLIQKLEMLKDKQTKELFEQKQRAVKAELQKLQEKREYGKDINLSVGKHTIIIP